MKIILEQADLSEPEIIIRGNLPDRELREIMELLSGYEPNKKKNPERMELYLDEKQYFIAVKEIIYFESNDDTIYAHTKDGVYKAKDRLYRLNAQLADSGFVQISKGVLLNTDYVRSVQAEFSGNYIVTMKETPVTPVISRRYFKEFKRKMLEEKYEYE